MLARLRHALGVDDELVARGEIEGLLFNVADIAATLERIETLLGDEEDEEGNAG